MRSSSTYRLAAEGIWTGPAPRFFSETTAPPPGQCTGCACPAPRRWSEATITNITRCMLVIWKIARLLFVHCNFILNCPLYCPSMHFPTCGTNKGFLIWSRRWGVWSWPSQTDTPPGSGWRCSCCDRRGAGCQQDGSLGSPQNSLHSLYHTASSWAQLHEPSAPPSETPAYTKETGCKFYRLGCGKPGRKPDTKTPHRTAPVSQQARTTESTCYEVMLYAVYLPGQKKSLPG